MSAFPEIFGFPENFWFLPQAVVETPSTVTEENVEDKGDDGKEEEEEDDKKESEEESNPDEKMVEDEQKGDTPEKEDTGAEPKKSQEIVYTEEELLEKGKILLHRLRSLSGDAGLIGLVLYLCTSCG